MCDISELDSSELGTKEYWDKQYETEIENFRQHGDMGDIWFGEDSVDRIVRWITKNKDIKVDSGIVDIGCGNGYILLNLAQRNFTKLLGIDYSESAVLLAKEIAKKENVPNVNYEVCNVLEDVTKFVNQFDVVHDKGTYDAISLNPENPKECREKYIKNIWSILKLNGLLIITSCNWTQEELLEQFKEYFKLYEVIPTPQFKFGNKVGNVVTSIVMQNCNL